MANNDRRSKVLRSFSELYGKIAGTGLIPPHSLEIEQSVLGACMIDRVAAQRVFDTIGDREPPFYEIAHNSIWNAISKLVGGSERVDLLSVTERLRKDGELELSIGYGDMMSGPAYLVELTSKVVTTANVEAHTRLLIEKHLLRELILKCEELKLRAFVGEDDTFDLLLDAEKVIADLSKVRHQGSAVWKSTEDLSVEALANIEFIRDRGLDVIGVPSELTDLDKMTLGWQNSDLIYIGARPSQGKTALSLVLARNAAGSRGIGVAFFSLEMKAMTLMQRMICAESGLNLKDVRKGRLEADEWRRYREADERLRALQIYTDDTSNVTVQYLRQKMRQLVQRKKNIGLVVVDYLQLMEPPAKQFSNRDNRDRELGIISKSLKSLAKEFDIPVICLSQLNRGLENRSDKRPMLSDLRESGNIEQDADVVILIYRPEVYGINVWGYPWMDQKPTEGMTELIIAKQRNGEIGQARVKFDPKCGEFSDNTYFPEYKQEDMEF